ncbi:hypothetical protein AAVH_07264 [Aphelenchoides avenae]|nr:hypothetical protein AAVH_07264 [Aphelenchus avenae]
MTDRIGEDALVDVGRCLNRFEVDSLQRLTWTSHTFLADKAHILPVRLLDEAVIGGARTSVSARDDAHRSVRFDDVTLHEAFQLGLVAIQHSHQVPHVGELERLAAVAATVQVAHLSLGCELRHLSPHSQRRLMFGFARVEELSLVRINGSQLTDDDLRECGRKQILEISVATADAEPLAVSDEAVLDYLFSPEYGMPGRQLLLSAFNASPQFVQKLVQRAHQATNIDGATLSVKHLPQRSQQLGGLHFIENEGVAAYKARLEKGLVFFVFDTTFTFHLVRPASPQQ